MYERHQKRFGQPWVLEQGLDNTQVRVLQERSDNTWSRLARDGNALPDLEPRQALDEAPVRGQTNTLPDTGISAHFHQVAPGESGHQVEGPCFPSLGVLNQRLGDLVRQQQPPLAQNKIDHPLRGVGIAKSQANGLAIQVLEFRLEQLDHLLLATLSQPGGKFGATSRFHCDILPCLEPPDPTLMSLPKNTRKYIEAQNFDAVEDEWLTRLSTSPSDLDYFTSTARALAATSGAEVAQQLLELLDEQLSSQENWEDRLSVLEATGEISYSAEVLNQEILSTLEKLYPESTVIQTLTEKMGLKRAVADLPRTWQKVHRLRGVLAYDVGTIVAMEGKGVGRVGEVNVQLEKLKVDFEKHPGLTVGFGAAGKVLEPLAPDHFLRRKLEAPEVLVSLAKSDPSALLRLVLISQPKLTASQVKETVSGLIADKSWAPWWAKARNHPQLVATGKGARQQYSWADSSAAAGEEIRVQFERADLEQKLEIFLREAKRSPEIAIEYGNALAQLVTENSKKESGEAIRILAALERSNLAIDNQPRTIDDILRTATDPAGVIHSIGDRSLRLTCFGSLPALRTDWPGIFGNAVGREQDAPVLDFLFETLWSSERNLAEELVDRILSQPAKRPAAFLWLLEGLGKAPYFGKRNPGRALGQLLRAKSLPAFSKYKVAMKRILEDGAVTQGLIQRLEPDQAESVHELFERTSLEEHLRDRLLTALYLRFPDFKTSASTSLYATMTVIDEKKAELRNLLEVEIPANRAAIEEARALGDLRENFEYKSARQRHEYLSARVHNLDGELSRVQPILFDQIDSSEVRIGVTVMLSSADGDGSTRKITILGPWESNPDQGILSYESEAAGNLLGKRKGDQVALGRDNWRIDSIVPWRGGK